MRLSWRTVYYKCMEMFEHDQLYEATDVAQWLNIPQKHRLMRYYLNRLAKDNLLVKIVWRHRMFFGRPELAYVFHTLDDIFVWEGGLNFRVRR